MTETTPRLTVTNYLDVISSWCFWAAPMWQELQERYAGRVNFQWKIALMDESGNADFARADGLVLPPQRNDDEVAIHVEVSVARGR